jgi:4-alpha-glucanotransferase
MRDRDLKAAALAAGLRPDWTDAFGARRSVSPPTLRALLAALHVESATARAAPRGFVPPLVVTDAARPVLRLPATLLRKVRRISIELEQGGRCECAMDRGASSTGQQRLRITLPPGYHRIEAGDAKMLLAAAPRRAFTLADATVQRDPRAWGIAVQVYGLRRRGDLGIGDFTALAEAAQAAGNEGAAALAISPVHALFAADAQKYSPYAPSNRCFLNALHADPDNLLTGREFADVPSTRRLAGELERLRRARLIDWSDAAALHRQIFERLFARLAAGQLAGAASFADFRAAGGDALQRHACFEAWHEQHAPPGGGTAAQPPHPRALRAFARDNAQRVTFHAFLQWCARRGLAQAQAAARGAGMAVGLIADLAVGADPAGSECWSRPDDMLAGANIGAPPDQLNALGQNWGLTTFSPFQLVYNGYAPFLDLLRATMRDAGGIRLDHVMALMRLWLMPAGASPAEGAYLHYPFDDLLRLTVLESWRHRCIVVGEDLGTVPPQCRRRLARAGVLGLDVLAFMRSGDTFLAPRKWRREAVAMTSTHDVAPVAGWWQSRDLDWRRRLGLFGAVGEADERRVRVRSRQQLARALAAAGIARVSPRSAAPRIVDAAVAAVATSPAALAIVPVEDLLGSSEQPNLPGTVAVHPNWRRRYTPEASALLDPPIANARIRLLRRARGRSP